jgi:hypothetical protein
MDMSLNKIAFYLLFSMLLTNHLNAQYSISRNSLPSFVNSLPDTSLEVILLPAYDNDSLLQNEVSSSFIYQFGVVIDINLNMYNVGKWDTLSSGDKIWRLKFVSKTALSLNFIYDDFWLPDGAKLFVYNNQMGLNYLYTIIGIQFWDHLQLMLPIMSLKSMLQM